MRGAGETYNNMAIVHQRQEDYDKSLEYYCKAHTIFERVHGPSHPLTATSHHNMGRLLHLLGSPEAALEAYGKALKIREEVLGPEHKDTASSRQQVQKLGQRLSAWRSPQTGAGGAG